MSIFRKDRNVWRLIIMETSTDVFDVKVWFMETLYTSMRFPNTCVDEVLTKCWLYSNASVINNHGGAPMKIGPKKIKKLIF